MERWPHAEGACGKQVIERAAMTPDGFPIISRPRSSIFLNVGQEMLGWTPAMASAERLAGTAPNGLVGKQVNFV